MTIQKNAEILVDKFRNLVDSEIIGEEYFQYSRKQETENSKKCAIIAVDEIIKELKNIEFNYELDFSENLIRYWNDVKLAIDDIL